MKTGVILYNTKHSPDPQGVVASENSFAVPSNCAVLIPLKETSTDIIRYVKNLRESSDFMDFDNKIGSSTEAKIYEVLWLCSTMFTVSDKKVRSREIIWFTNQDAPHQSNQVEFQQAMQKASDLQSKGYLVNFFPMCEDFNGGCFYQEFLALLQDLDDNFDFPSYEENDDKLVQSVFRRGYRRRALAYLEFEITENTKFGVGVYSNKRAMSVAPKIVKLSRSNNDEIVTKRVIAYAEIPANYNEHDEDAEEEIELDFSHKLDQSQMIKYQQVGGERIDFTTLEAFEIKQVMNPKIKLLGFKLISEIDPCQYYSKMPLFVYPHDGQIKNSTIFFRALWERLWIDQKAAICIYMTRLKSIPRLAALIPVQQSNQDGEIVTYDGFQMITFPYSDDIRNLDALKPKMSIDEDEDDKEPKIREILQKIIKKTRLNYVPTMVDNPVLSRIYARIQAEVFNEEISEEAKKDSILPEVEGQDARIHTFVDELEELIGGFEDVTVNKRKNKENVATEKRAKLAEIDIDGELILSKCKSGDIKQLTVNVLKDYLTLKNVTGLSKMKKPELVAKIVELN